MRRSQHRICFPTDYSTLAILAQLPESKMLKAPAPSNCPWAILSSRVDLGAIAVKNWPWRRLTQAEAKRLLTKFSP
jgi:hypothetical protein